MQQKACQWSAFAYFLLIFNNLSVKKIGFFTSEGEYPDPVLCGDQDVNKLQDGIWVR